MINEALIKKNTQIQKVSITSLQQLRDMIQAEYNRNNKELDLNSYDISELKTLEYCFSSCDKLETIHIEMWDTTNIISMDSMFFNCTSLKNININSWNIENLLTTDSMFFGCKSLETLNISRWRPYKLRSMGKMFFKCSKLKELLFPQIYLFPDRRDTQDMFKGCFTLSRNKNIPEL